MKPAPNVGAPGSWGLTSIVFFQMLPATLVVAAIRPLFAKYHGGAEWAMHAFMAINMAGAALVVPFLSRRWDRKGASSAVLRNLCALDALLLLAMTLPLASTLVLALRFVEGVAHVGAASLLLSVSARRSAVSGSGREMGLAGAALMFAIALGNGCGGLLVALDVRAPFLVGAVTALGVACVASRFSNELAQARPRPRAGRLGESLSLLVVPAAASFVGRFTVGCVVVTFALFAHSQHQLSDRSIGGLFALLTLPFALLVYPLARLSDRLSRALVLGVGALGYACALLVLGWVDRGLLPVVMTFAGICSAAIFATLLCYGASLVGPGRRTEAMGVINAAGCLGMLLGPAAAGTISALLRSAEDPVRGYRAAFVLAAFSVFVWWVLSLPWLKRRFAVETERVAGGCPSNAPPAA